MKSLQEVGAKMYQQAAPQQPGAQPGPDPTQGAQDNGNNGGNGNVYDADYKDVD